MDLTASKITQEALMILKSRNCQVWRQNNLTVRKRKGIVTKGVSDIIGYNKGTGVAIFCECKKIGDVLSGDQIVFLSLAQAANCLCLIATEKAGAVALIPFVDYVKD
jgi:hypothetical protein